MGRNGIGAAVLTTDVIAIVDDGLGAMYEVSGGLPLHISTIIREALAGDST